MITRKSFSSRRAFWSKTCLAALFVASFAAGESAFGQGYTTTFDGTPTYTDGGSLSGQNGWDTNDAARASTAEDVGQSDYVGQVDGYPGSSPANFQGALGGLYHGTTAPTSTTASELPGSPIVYLYHPVSPGGAAAYVFNTDFDIAFPTTGTTTGTPNTTRDAFGFNFQTSGLANLFSVNFTPNLSGNGNSANEMIIGYSVNGAASTSTSAVLYNSIYHLQLSVDVVNKMMTIMVTGTNTFTLSNISLASIDPSSVEQLAATWTLKTTDANTIDSNGGYTQAGSNAIVFDNFAFTVPEPSTWAMLGLGAVAGGMFLRRRSRA